MGKIIASGSYLPRNHPSNEDLIAEFGLDSSSEWIEQRTGIKYRHLASPEEDPVKMAVEAGRACLKKLSEDIRSQISCVIVASMSAPLTTPNIASQIIGHLQLDQAWGFDVNAACSGFVLALDIANSLIQKESEGYCLVIASEKMSQIIDFQDRSTCVLFGDGAGALLIKQDGQGLKNYQSQIFTQAKGQEALRVLDKPSGQAVLTMEGRQVFNFVLRKVMPDLKDFASDHDDYDFIVSHQANARFLDMMEKKLSLDSSRLPTNIDQVANMSAASIPVLMDQMVEAGQLSLSGQQKLILCGFGAGLTWALAYFEI